ncbi:hypothetical protein ACFXON_24570, partial [Bacillus subtilis]
VRDRAGLSMSYVTVALQVGTPEAGLWCEACARPSCIRFPLSAVLPTGVLAVAPLMFCLDHQTIGEAWTTRRQGINGATQHDEPESAPRGDTPG